MSSAFYPVSSEGQKSIVRDAGARLFARYGPSSDLPERAMKLAGTAITEAIVAVTPDGLPDAFIAIDWASLTRSDHESDLVDIEIYKAGEPIDGSI